MKKIIFLLGCIFFISGCSVHQAWNGDKKPGLSYASIDKMGKVSSNSISATLIKETFEKLIAEGDKQKIAKFLAETSDRSTLFIWSAEYNGAMVNGSGQTCLQAASYARSTNTTVDISSSLLNLLTQIDLNSDNENDKLLALSVMEAITNLTSSSEQSTYLSAGLFGLCLLQANGGLSEAQVESSIAKLIEASTLKLESKSKALNREGGA
ncbi:hypothetical protein [Amphritea balenae]|uniref:Lipoprotein n=1 Tax=Amphritea balenae TaxID=452629 RepID=A0A3P1T020_9GAMM|nr:hypothetical protein [Amphritea balenae]RRD01733.1 hypothetical protein EHS89_04070 [Amphritea balenae]GGK54531.1 hypothetical protein GCM10007941_00730 [Amphritea balenae]